MIQKSEMKSEEEEKEVFGPKLCIKNSINKNEFFQEETEIDYRFEDQVME